MISIVKYLIFICAVFLFSGCSNSTEANPKPFNSSEHYKQELKAVRREKYKKRKLLNKSEMRLLLELEGAIKEKDYRIVLQTSFGSFLQHNDKNAFLKVNCKRADFVIINKFGYPEVVIEYNGEGHYNKSSHLRDEIKELACNSAEIPFVTISYKDKHNLNEVIQEKIIPILQKWNKQP